MKIRPLAVSALGAGMLVLVASQAAASNGPPLHSNSELYRQKNPPAATGRSGNASLAARALMNKDGTTDVNITTGTLDSTATAPGNISKVQIKTYNGAGDVEWTKNYSSLTSGGSLAYNFPDLHRGQPIQTQGNINGIDKRTDVVTVTGNVKLRPDIAVEDINAKDKAVVGTYVNIAGVVAELNGDIGATTSCNLAIDGTQVSAIPGMYVDAASKVSCAFTYKFTTVGTHSITVSASSVVPGDYDTSNNSKSTTIQIVPNTAPLYYSASAYSYHYVNSWNYGGFYQYSDGTYAAAQDWSYNYGYDERYENAGISGWSPVPLAFPLASVALSQASDGTSVDAHAFANLPADWSWGDASYGAGVVWRFDPASYTYFYLQSYNWGGYGGTWTEYGRYAGEVTYFDNGFYSYWYDYAGSPPVSGGWAYNYDSTSGYGQPWPVGAQYNVSLAVTDANGAVMQASPTFATQTSTYASANPQYACYAYSWPWGNEQYCYGYQYLETWTYGYAYGLSQ